MLSDHVYAICIIGSTKNITTGIQRKKNIKSTSALLLCFMTPSAWVAGLLLYLDNGGEEEEG